MRRIYNYTSSVFLILLLLFSGCLKEQEDLFTESAAVRLNNAISGIDSTLTNSPNGWELQYFATNESPGYPLLVKFNSNGEAVVAANNELLNNQYTEAKSLFDVIGDDGPVLTFNTYNNVLHLFSDPMSEPVGVGLGGDYEFIVLDRSDSLVHLKGKKNGTEITLNKFPEGLAWPNYFAEVNRIDNKLFGAEMLNFISGTDTVAAYNGASHIFEMQYPDSIDETTIPFILTSKGLKFYSVFTTTTNTKVQSFYLNDDETKLISVDDKNTFFEGVSVGKYLVNSQVTYAFDTTRMSDNYKSLMRILCQDMAERYKGKRNIDYLALSYESSIGHSFFFATTPTITRANFKIELKVDQQSSNRVSISKIGGVYDANGELFLSGVPSIGDAWQELEGTYNLTSTLSKQEIRFEDKDNASRFFVVIRR